MCTLHGIYGKIGLNYASYFNTSCFEDALYLKRLTYVAYERSDGKGTFDGPREARDGGGLAVDGGDEAVEAIEGGEGGMRRLLQEEVARVLHRTQGHLAGDAALGQRQLKARPCAVEQGSPPCLP